MLPNIGYGELLVLLALALLLFGAKQIPEIARSLGRAINSFKAGMKDGVDEQPKDAPKHEPQGEPSEKP